MSLALASANQERTLWLLAGMEADDVPRCACGGELIDQRKGGAKCDGCGRIYESEPETDDEN